jgi:hypothetical protein
LKLLLKLLPMPMLSQVLSDVPKARFALDRFFHHFI